MSSQSQKIERSQIKRITREAVVLLYLRRSRRISMRKAGAIIGVTSSAISHYEQGRMNLPTARIPELVAAFGFTMAEFDQFVLGKPLPVLSLRDECEQIIQRMSDSKLKQLHAVLVSFVA